MAEPMLRTTLPGILSCAALTAQAQTITTYRWWVDDDLATLTTTPVAPQADLDLQVTDPPARDGRSTPSPGSSWTATATTACPTPPA